MLVSYLLKDFHLVLNSKLYSLNILHRMEMCIGKMNVRHFYLFGGDKIMLLYSSCSAVLVFLNLKTFLFRASNSHIPVQKCLTISKVILEGYSLFGFIWISIWNSRHVQANMQSQISCNISCCTPYCPSRCSFSCCCSCFSNWAITASKPSILYDFHKFPQNICLSFVELFKCLLELVSMNVVFLHYE